MAYVITETCSGAKYTNCVDVCPVDAFREGEDMLYIDPDVCISCNACLTECPTRAIYPEASVPEDQQQYIDINALESKRLPKITERRVEGDKKKVAKEQSDKRFAVIGAGPSGFFTSDALLKQYPGAQIDLIEKLPTPFGLVRYGVAPDHPGIKTVTENFTALIKNNSSISFYGNVDVGKDVKREQLLKAYNAVVYSTGGSASKRLAVEGHDLAGVYGSSEFVGWYNGHPEQKHLAPKLHTKSMSIIGVGNVALDIARVVCLPESELKQTDIADHALQSIAKSGIEQVNVVARKGPAQAAFTPKELQQLLAHPALNLEIDPTDLELDANTEAWLQLPENSEAKENISLLRKIPQSKSDGSKTIRFVFNSNPEKIVGDEQAVSGLQIGINKTYLNSEQQLQVEASGESKLINCGIVISATGYQGKEIKGLEFDQYRGVIANENGRVQLAQSELTSKEYVAGWIKRGASGVIGTNKQCAVATVKTLVEDLNQADSDNVDGQAAEPSIQLENILQQNNVDYFSFADWMALDAYESKLGRAENRPRRKVVDIEEMLKIKAANQQLIAKATPVENQEIPVKQFDTDKPIEKHYRTCTLCEAMCGIVVEYQGEHIVSIAGDKDDTFSDGHICPKGYALQDLHNDPERLKTPKKRVGDQWIDIDWDEALEEVAQRLVAVQKKHGNDSVAGYWGNPASHNMEVMINIPPFKKALKSKNMFSASSLDQMPHQLTSFLMYGHNMALTIPDVDRTDYMLMLGANPAASNGSLMTAGDILGRLERIKARGGKLVLIDPRRTETALYASEHQFIKPGSDALFLMGLIQVVFAKGLVKQTKLPLKGKIEDIAAIVNSVPLATIAELTHIPQTEIERIATEFAQAERAVCYGRMGISVQEFGGLNHWLIQLLNIITGNLDCEGGMMFTSPAVDLTDTMGRGSFDRYRSRVRNLPEFNRELPAATLADEMLTPDEGQIKAFVTTAGNPVISSPNGVRLEQALANLDFMVSIDFYLNETTKHADIILPPCGPFEHALYDLVFTNFAVRNVTRFSEPLFNKKSFMRSDLQIYTFLTNRIEQLKAKKIGPVAKLKMGLQHKIKEFMTVERIVDMGLRMGLYGEGWKSYLTGKGLTLKKLKKHQHGMDLGPLESRLPGKLFTKDKKINLLPTQMVADIERLKAYVDKSAQAPALTLIGRRDLRTNNSWMHNSQRLVKGKNRCDLFVHPDTAQQYDIEQGEQVYITSAVGALKVDVTVTEDIMPNVVSLPHGWGHHRKGMKISVASSNPGVSVNDITDQNFIDEMSGNAALNGIPVELQKIW